MKINEKQLLKWVIPQIQRLIYKWKPYNQALKNARRKSKLPDKRTKWQYQCNHCKTWFKKAEIEVDHIVPKGSITSWNRMSVWLKRYFVPVEGFQILCIPCHLKKTNEEKRTGAYDE